MAQDGSYSNGFHHSLIGSHGQPPNAASTMDGASQDVDDLGPEGSAALDHALLESLFYNEMMMLNPSFPGSSNFLSHHFNEATQPRQQYPPAPAPALTVGDPNTIAEKDLLRDFGVSESPIQPSTPRQNPVPLEGSASTSNATALHSWSAPLVHPQHAHMPPAIQVPYHPYGSNHVPIYPAPSHPANPAYPMANTETTYSYVAASKPALERPPLSIDTQHSAPTLSQDHRSKQLVDQFATLAARLGIELPTTVLQSLTALAAKNDPQIVAATAAVHPANSLSSTPTLTTSTSPFKHQGGVRLPDSSLSSVPTLSDSEDPTELAPSTLHELRKTAEEAIASISKKRPAVDMDGADSMEGGSNSGNLKDGSKNQPQSSKRKKKPRLSDCESRLAELRAENELLKRHLENVSNKAYRFDQEKEAAGKRIHGLLEDNAGPEEMNRAVQEFTEMYSDYGRNRQQELSFHLEQLQRLVNPTNFTKMGLWTLGQNSVSPKHNPIAGILQKELDITSQQGRKILDQSEKIRVVCDNLKECLALLAKLKSLCEQKTQIFQHRMDKCREILTTKQVVKLIKWIDDHTQLLETVCPGWGTEHIHSSISKHS